MKPTQTDRTLQSAIGCLIITLVMLFTVFRYHTGSETLLSSTWAMGLYTALGFGLLSYMYYQATHSEVTAANETTEGFKDADDAIAAFRATSEYKALEKKLTEKYTPLADKKRPLTELLQSGASTVKIPESQQSLVNFYALGCRFTGYLGPMTRGYMDPDVAVQMAVKAGCRVFVLEIDYFKDCTAQDTLYFPRLVVRDGQGKNIVSPDSTVPYCESMSSSTIKKVCESIQTHAYSSAAQNASDPVILVLYFLGQPPGSYKSKPVLDYYSTVAKLLAPLKDRFLGNELEGGTFHRQSQESRLLANSITVYQNKVLVFSNANTIGFREVPGYKPEEDLDYLTNMRLAYTQTALGITQNDSIGSTFGILQTAEDYLTIPQDRTDQVLEQTKMRWTICLSKVPTDPVTPETFQKLVSTYGVQCIPISIFDETNGFMFTEGTFQKYSYLPKPESLRYIKPPTVVPATPNPSTDANQGKLRVPTI